MPETPNQRPEWRPPLSDREQRERDIAADIAANPNKATKTAQVIYRCKKHRCFLAAVIRREGRLYIVYRQHVVPETLPPEAEELKRQLPPWSGMDHMQAFELPDNELGWWPDWSMNCGHSAYTVTREQLAADIRLLRGKKGPVVTVDGNVFGYEHEDENDRVDTRRAR